MIGLGGRNHPAPVLGLPCLFLARSDLLPEFLLGNRIVGFTVIRPDARGRLDDLPNQGLGDGSVREEFTEPNHRLTEQRRPFFEVVRLWRPDYTCRSRVWHRFSLRHWRGIGGAFVIP